MRIVSSNKLNVQTNVLAKAYISSSITSLMFLFSPKAYSVEDVATQLIKSDPMSGSYLMQLVLGLLVVILCIVALAWFTKKMNRFHSITDDSLKVITGISMGTREKIVLLQVGEEQLLIGVSPGRINKLHVLSKPITENDLNKSNSKTSAGGKVFSDKLKTMMANANTASVKKKNN